MEGRGLALGPELVHLLGGEPALAARVEVDLVGLVGKGAVLDERAEPEEQENRGSEPNEEEVFGGSAGVLSASSKRPDRLRAG